MKIADGQASLTESETTSLPKVCHDLVPVFESAEADEPPPYRKIHCAIELLPDRKLSKGRLYSMNPAKREELCKFIGKNLRERLHLA